MQSVDPVTNGWPQDPLAGFLPPNDASHRGEGYVSFLVKPKPELSSGATIMNQATIVFDFNTPIDTPQVINTIDSAKPTSTVSLLPPTSPASFTVSWTGSDPGGSGINSYDIYSNTDGGPFTLWLAATNLASSTFNGATGHAYGFYSVATDNVGNKQVIPSGAQASTAVPGETYPLTVGINPAGGGNVKDTQTSGAKINCPGDCTEGYNSGTAVNLIASAAAGYTFVNWTNCDSSNRTACTMNMTSAKSVTANFVLNNTVTVHSATGQVDIVLSTSSPGCGFSNVHVFTESQAGSDPDFDYPYGLVGFSLNCGVADVGITFIGAGDLSTFPYRKYGPIPPSFNNPQWYTMPNATFVGNTVTLHLVDGQWGDDTPQDGWIIDQGGPGQFQQEPVAAIPAMTGSGMVVFAIILAAYTILFIRRMKRRV